MNLFVMTVLTIGLLPMSAAANQAINKDAKWLLDSKLKNSGQFAWDKRSDATLAAIVPDLKLKNQAKPDLKGIVQVDVMMPDDKQVIEGRYVIISGARPHEASTQGWIWIDTKDGSGAFALNECPTQSNDEGCVLVGSKNFGASELPRNLTQKLKGWIQALPATLDNKPASAFPLYFIGGDKKIVPFQLK